ncbi:MULTISPECIES: isochorismate synthase [Acidithrix]|uniref:isochorismate synthase n=1 Tax=Acidithrix ferrooxidans TaxID=1280514 RepID=A0A0D8HKY5_9ACTN|nr:MULTISPECIES: isochorismate synthase [Acidithrix]KJF17756.1 isochorismate synthase EntC [Acidithrix ferrooxidans]
MQNRKELPSRPIEEEGLIFANSCNLGESLNKDRVMGIFRDEIQNGSAIVFMRPGLMVLASGPYLTTQTLDPKSKIREITSNFKVDRPETASLIDIFGLIPFDPKTQPTYLYVPSFVINITEEQSRLAVIGSDQNDAANKLSALADSLSGKIIKPHEEACSGDCCAPSNLAFTVDDQSWLNQAISAIDRIRNGEFEKIVLSRRTTLNLKKPLNRMRSLSRLIERYPGALSFSYGDLIGATPELLIRREGDFFESHPLAGTASTGNESALLASYKDNHEHRVVTDHITSRLNECTARIDIPTTPSITNFGDICHLGTPIRGLLRDPMNTDSIDLLLKIHPTPAVAGIPQAAAVAFIQEIEDEPRHLYAGAIGYQNLSGDGEWHLTIRTVSIDGLEIEFQAGVGIVNESDPNEELREVQAKLTAMLPIVT